MAQALNFEQLLTTKIVRLTRPIINHNFCTETSLVPFTSEILTAEKPPELSKEGAIEEKECNPSEKEEDYDFSALEDISTSNEMKAYNDLLHNNHIAQDFIDTQNMLLFPINFG